MQAKWIQNIGPICGYLSPGIGIPQTTVWTFMNHIPVHVGYTQGLSESQLGFGMLLGAIRTVCFLS